MARQLTIKQIASLAGVSAGTVDRIIHNRGRVSEKALARVREVLDSQGYKNNIHSSAISLRKSFKLIAAIPSSAPGEYWDLVRRGIVAAEEEYSDVSLSLEFCFFDEFAGESCKTVFDSVLDYEPSAVMIGTTFVEQSRELCERLDQTGVPYALIDGSIEGSHPVAVFEADQTACGRILARLLNPLSVGGAVATMNPRRTGTVFSNNTRRRLAAFTDYYREIGREDCLKPCRFSVVDREAAESEISDFLAKNPDVKVMVVLNSASYVVSDALVSLGRTDIKVGGFDVTENNARCIRNGTLEFVVSQRPEYQGFNAVESVIRYLVYGTLNSSEIPVMRADIIIKENLNQYLPYSPK